MKKTLFAAIFLLAPLLNAAAQQEYFTPQQNYFVDGGIWYHQLTDSTAEVRENAFEGLTVQDPLVIPETVRDSAGNAYTVTRIGARAFNNKNIADISLPYTLLEIGDRAFSGNDSLHHIDLPSGLRRIEDFAFTCRLEGTVTLPDSLEFISHNSFVWNYTIGTMQCAITAYVIDGNPRFCTVDGILYNKDSTVLLTAPNVMVDTFYIPSFVRRLENGSLRDCGARYIVLNDSLREMGLGIFDSPVTNIHIPASVTSIEGNVFNGNGATNSVSVDSASRHYKIVDQMVLSYDGDTLVMIFGVWYGAKELPEGIRVIAQQTFNGITTIGRIALPETLEEVGDYGLRCSYCSFDFPSNLRKIGKMALGGVHNNVTLPYTLTDIADSAFAGSFIDTITFNDSIRVIPRGVLAGCSELKKVILGSNVEHIMPGAFSAAYNPRIPVLRINDYLPETLRTIGRDAFRNRTIARVKFQRTPDTVGEYAFNRARRVFFDDTLPPVVFDSSFMAGCDVYLPCHGTAAFTAAPGWGPAFNYMESPCPPTAIDDATPDAPFSVTAVGGLLTVTRTEAVEVGIYDLLGRCLLQAPASTSTLHFRAPAPGLYIVKAAGATRKTLLK